MSRAATLRAALAGLAMALAACGGEEQPPPEDAVPGAPTTTAHPAGGAYPAVQYVILSASEPGSIYWTVDGSVPAQGGAGTSSSRSPAFWIRVGPGTTTLRFFGVDDAGNRGPEGSETYVVEVPP